MTQLMILNLAWTCPYFVQLSWLTILRLMLKGNLIGDPTETAFIQYALDRGYDVKGFLEKYPRVAELPFDSDRKLMSTVHPLPDGKFLVAVKGAPDQLLKRCVARDKAGDVARLIIKSMT